ncbi:Heme transporter hrg-1 [Blattella germanica]|nr:Heme transporter hrg-1 [Blattella germanica]
MCNQTCKKWFHLITSVLGVIFGLSSFIAFFCVYGNLNAGLWGFISGVFASLCLHLHYLHIKQKLDSYHSVQTLHSLKILATVGALAGLAGTFWYLFFSIYHHVPILPVQSSTFIAAVWAFLTCKWGILLFVYCRHYIIILQGDYPPLTGI